MMLSLRRNLVQNMATRSQELFGSKWFISTASKSASSLSKRKRMMMKTTTATRTFSLSSSGQLDNCSTRHMTRQVSSIDRCLNSSFTVGARLKSTAATSTYDQSIDTFPSIIIGPDRSIEPQGSFAEAQAQVRLP